jgi:hypothetical protein
MAIAIILKTRATKDRLYLGYLRRNTNPPILINAVLYCGLQKCAAVSMPPIVLSGIHMKGVVG